MSAIPPMLFADTPETSAALALLWSEGFRIKRAAREGEWTVAGLSRALGMPLPTVHSRLQMRACPPWTATLRGPTGRVTYFTASEAVIEFLRKPLQPGIEL